MLLVCTAWLIPGDVLSQALSQEYQLKAMYLRKIPSFVEWPRAPRTAARELFNCARWATTRSVPDSRGRSGAFPLRAKDRIALGHKEQELDGCEGDFFQPVRGETLRKILEGLKGKSVLTIGESEDFWKPGHGGTQF